MSYSILDVFDFVWQNEFEMRLVKTRTTEVAFTVSYDLSGVKGHQLERRSEAES